MNVKLSTMSTSTVAYINTSRIEQSVLANDIIYSEQTKAFQHHKTHVY